MNAVLRIALTYFAMVGIQRWINAVGLLFLILATAAFAFGNAGAEQSVFALCIIGVALILITPVFAGGVGLRQASRPGVLHLRPYGRQRMLLGTTLAITLFAMLAALPSFATYGYLALHGLDAGTRFPPPLAAFGFMWAMFAVGLIYIFATCGSMLGVMTFWLLPLAATQLGRHIGLWEGVISPRHVFGFGLGAWTLFALWYLRTGTIRRPTPNFGNSSNSMAESSPFQWLVAMENTRVEATRGLAVSQYLLGSASSRLFVITGLWVAAIFLLLHYFVGNDRPKRPGQLLFMLPFLAFQFGAMGYTTARRARLLWLRAGMSRKALFLLCERLALRASLITWVVIAAVALALAALPDMSRLPQLLLYAGAQAVAGVVAFYAGLATVKTWNAGDILLFIALGVLFVFQFALGIESWRDARLTGTATSILLVGAVLAVALRWHATRRWRALDWRIAKPVIPQSQRT